ncbi:hypothetical protein ACEWY4_025648 [Coilia grayii]|uniref:Adrenomedullin n=1 Tax=Coilia grayii TaxID=363190 RepID=A0ABD1ISJ6_9TELE
MRHYTDRHRCLPSMTGGSVVKMVVLLMLTANLTAATPLRNTERREADTVLHNRSIQKLKDLLALHRPENHTSTDTVFDNKDIESYLSDDINLRAKRAPPRGCQLGTCQMHNLADTLSRIGNTNGKEESKKANDPKGYGR